jgi:polyphosphate glucokinase
LKEILGIDIGGSGIKGAPVDVASGNLQAARFRVRTPDPAKPHPVADMVGEVAKHFAWNGPIGCGFPAVVQAGVVRSAANIHPKWIGVDAQALFSEICGCPVRVINDADAAGLAEMPLAPGRGARVVLVITIGTGLESALFIDGHLLPSELLHDRWEDAGRWRCRQRRRISWKRWEASNNSNTLVPVLSRPDHSGRESVKHENFYLAQITQKSNRKTKTSRYYWAIWRTLSIKMQVV